MTKIVSYTVYSSFSVIVIRDLIQFSVFAEYPDGKLTYIRSFPTERQAKRYADDLAYEYRLAMFTGGVK